MIEFHSARYIYSNQLVAILNIATSIVVFMYA